MFDLVTYFEEQFKIKPESFPSEGGLDYLSRYKLVADFLNNYVHDQVEVGAAYSNPGSFFTGHGKEHIRVVLKRASEIVSLLKINLTGYEAYILIMAIQFHDTGNFYGRNQHEKKLSRFTNEVRPLFSYDSVEINVIKRIARAHGGKIKGDSDTLGDVPEYDRLFHKEVRLKLIAAILRMADELAEDYTRANRFVVQGVVGGRSSLYHKFASCLNSLSIDAENQKVDVLFFVDVQDMMKKWQKEEDYVYLLDYITERMMKMYFECMYCIKNMRYKKSRTEGMVTLESIDVEIRINDANYDWDDDDRDPIEPISYSIQERGYPQFVNPKPDMATWCSITSSGQASQIVQSRPNLAIICPDLKYDGEMLKEILELREKNKTSSGADDD